VSEEPKNPVRIAILELTAARGAGKTIAPEDAAKAVSPENFVCAEGRARRSDPPAQGGHDCDLLERQAGGRSR